jgi:hypothetical protein
MQARRRGVGPTDESTGLNAAASSHQTSGPPPTQGRRSEPDGRVRPVAAGRQLEKCRADERTGALGEPVRDEAAQIQAHRAVSGAARRPPHRIRCPGTNAGDLAAKTSRHRARRRERGAVKCGSGIDQRTVDQSGHEPSVWTGIIRNVP